MMHSFFLSFCLYLLSQSKKGKKAKRVILITDNRERLMDNNMRSLQTGSSLYVFVTTFCLFTDLICVFSLVCCRMGVQAGLMRPTVAEEEERPPETLLR